MEIMEINPTTVTIFSLAVAGIVWLVRLESKANATSIDVNDLYSKVDAHVSDDEKHFNYKAFAEFEKRIEGEIRSVKESVVDVKADIKEVKEYCEDIDGKIDRLK